MSNDHSESNDRRQSNSNHASRDRSTLTRREASRRRFLDGSAKLVGAGTVLSLGSTGVAAEDHEEADDEDADDEEAEPDDEERELTQEDIDAFVDVFDDQPMAGGQEDPHTPGHVWKWINEDVFLFLEFDEADPDEAETLRYVGFGVKGAFCEQTQPGPGAAAAVAAVPDGPGDVEMGDDGDTDADVDGQEDGDGHEENGDDEPEPWPSGDAHPWPGEDGPPENEFTHFHRRDAEEWDLAHGGEPGDDEGYWLVHVAVDEFDRPWGDVERGVDYRYMPTEPEECEELPEVDFEVDEAGELEEEEFQAVLDLFDDVPMEGGQDDPFTPKHVWKWIDDETFVALELEHPNPDEAEMITYLVLGVEGEFTEEDQPHPDFSHFHSRESETWPGAHGGDPGEEGYWLLHVAVDEFRQPWGDLTPGVDRGYAPTPLIDEDELQEVDLAEEPPEDVTEVRVTQTGEEGRPFVFDPQIVTIDEGETVRWVHDHEVYHTVTSTASLSELAPDGRFDVAMSQPGETFEYTFEEEGPHHYFCRPHGLFMMGTVQVGDPEEFEADDGEDDAADDDDAETDDPNDDPDD